MFGVCPMLSNSEKQNWQNMTLFAFNEKLSISYSNRQRLEYFCCENLIENILKIYFAWGKL